MDEFNNKYTCLNSPDDSNQLFTPSQLIKGFNDSIDNSNDEEHSLPTEGNNPFSIEIPQPLSQNNNNEILNNSVGNVGLISHNNIIAIEPVNPPSENPIFSASTREETFIKRGRREKGSIIIGGHTGHARGNLLRKDGTSFMDSMYKCLNNRIKLYNPSLKLENINFKKQFGYNKDNERFIQQKLYKILRYRSKNNQKVIEKMTKVYKDKVFMYIINCTFEYIYGKYIAEKNTIYFGEGDIHYNCFETLSQMAIKRENKNRKNNEHWTEEQVQIEITYFIKSSKNFLINAKGKGELNRRERRRNIEVLCDYEVVMEIEDFLGNQKPYIY